MTKKQLKDVQVGETLRHIPQSPNQISDVFEVIISNTTTLILRNYNHGNIDGFFIEKHAINRDMAKRFVPFSWATR